MKRVITSHLCVSGIEGHLSSPTRPVCIFSSSLSSVKTISYHRPPSFLCQQITYTTGLVPQSVSQFLPLRPVAVCPPVWAHSVHTSPVRPDEDDKPRPVQLSQRQRLQLAVRDYGATVVVFHVTISLASLGFFYVAVKR